MGLLQKAVETYETHQNLVGVYTESKALLAPLAHTVKKADLEVTITAEGNFYDANTNCKGTPIIIPVSMESAGRSGKVIAPHPLSDQLCYLAPYVKPKYEAYIQQLTAWEQSEFTHPKLHPILTYVKKGTILNDLARVGVIRLNAKGIPSDDKQEKFLVCWRIIGLEDSAHESCWNDDTLFASFIRYYLSTLRGLDMCMVSGAVCIPAKQHIKGIVSASGNAKLISTNDKNGFTYRGRFTDESQALTVSYEVSQKAHNALRWLVDRQGVQAVFGGRTFLCWNPKGRTIMPPYLPFMTPPKPITLPSEYQDELQKTLLGEQSKLDLTDDVVLATFDAATTGRLSLTYYNELQAHDFLERLHDWDASCCWPHRYWGISSPRLSQIVHYAFGTQRAEKGQFKMIADNQILAQQMQRLIACRVDKATIDLDIVKSLVERASNLNIYKCREADAQQKDDIRENLLFVTCAVIRKYRMNRFKEEWEMSLNPNKMDRSYQYGRLMAIFEQIEGAVSYKNGLDHKTSYTIRHQNAFRNKPLTTTEDIHRHLRDAYLPRLSTRSQDYYQNLIGEVIEMLSHFPETDMDLKLSETYLLGYYLQRSDMMPKKQHKDEQEEEV